MFAASRRSGARCRPAESNENSLGTPADPLPTRSPRSPLISIQDPSRNPSDGPTGSGTSDSKKCLGDIPIKAPRSLQSLTARGSPRVSHGNGVHTALVRERGYSSRVLSAAAEVRSSVPVEVPYFEPHDEPSFWNDHNVQVLIRIRPLSGMEVAMQGYKRCLVQESSQTSTWAEHPETRFTFDHVACESMSQEKLFKVVGLPMVENCMSGYNSCMFAYGQTGSGKTYTMMGEIHEMDSGLSEDRGITPRIFEYLFTRIREEEVIRSGEQLKYSCKCSFLEIYNEQITDLLQPSPTNLQLREDLNKGVYVENLKEHEVSSVKDVFELLLQGAANRKIAATHMNSESSRSHSVFTCIIESRWEKDSMTHLRFGRLNLVDLAGSERQKSSGAEGGRLKEAANINRSLSTLGLVIMTLVEIANGKHRHVPYRDSKLTFLLQDSLGGNSKTAIIANVSPSICSASETLSTLKFAQRAKLIQNNAKVNEDASGDVMALQQQIQKLKDQLTLLTKNQSIPTLLCYPSAILEQPNSGDFDNVSNSAPRGSPDSFNNTGLLNKKMNYLEATLLGSLRREKIADATVRRLEADISHMNRLAHQRENDAHQMKRLLKFREEKLKRLELLADDLISSDGYLMEENTALSEEIQLLRERIDRNPELTQFALENKRLLEQIRMFEDFYQQGEREKLLDEISHLRNQFLKFLDEKFAVPNGDSSQNDDAIRELDSCRRQLSACQEYNDRLTRELDSLCHQLKEYHDDARQTKSLGVDPNLAEGCSEDGIASCEQVNLISHINTDPRMGDIVPSQLMNVQKELRDARILVKAMDLQQIRLTEELDTLKQENIRYFELLQGKVYDGTGAEDADKLALDATLERTHKDHKESKTFDMHLQDNHASQLICKIEMKHIPDRFEADTAKTILYLQKELAELQQHVHLMKASQLPAKEDSFLSKTKYEELHNKFCILTQENDRLSNLVAIKDAEISTLSDDWEKAIIELTNFLIDGWRSLEDASDCIGSVVHSFPRGNEWISGHVERAIEVFIEREKSIANLQKRLEDAQKMGLEMELKLNSLKGATLAVTEVQQLENDQNSKELSHLSQLLGEKVSRVHELENIIKRKEDDLMEVEKSAKAANAVIRKLRAMSSVESFDLAAESMISELVNADPLLRMDSDFPWCETKYAQNKDMDMSSKVLLPFPIEHNSVGNRKLKAEADLSYLRKIDIHVEMAKKMVMDSNVALCTLYADTEKYFGSLLSDINSTYAAVKMLIGSLINDFRVANKEFKRLKEQRKINPPIMIGYSSFNAPDTSKSANNSTVVNIMIDRFRETCALLSSIQVGFNSLFGLCGDATQDEREICPGTDLQHVHKSPRYGKSEQYEELSSPNSALIRHMREESEQAMGSLREMHFHLSMLLDGSEQRDVTGCPAGGLCSNELPAIGKNPSLSHTNHRRPSDQLAMMELCQILQTLEERLKEVDANCSETRQVLSHKLSYARHDAQEKSKPTDDLFLKFEQAQHIMEEAEFVLNALLIANEDVKHERDCCKQANEELHKEKVALTEEVQRLEASNLSEARHFKSLQEQIQMSLTDILNIISTFQGTSQRANLVVGAEPNANCSDIVSLGYEVLQCIQTSRSWLEDIMSDIVEKDFELFALHQCHSGLKSEEMAATLRQVQHELATKTAQIDNILVEQKLREPNLAVNEAAVSSSRYDLEQAQNEIGILSSENDVLRHLLEDAEMKQKHAEELLVDKTKIIESSLNICRGINMHTSVEEISDELTKVKIERDNLCAEIAYLNDKLEMASALADENEAIAVEAHQIAEVSKIYAEDKEEEVKILERSVEALEDTINIMERKVSDMKEEVESYRLIRKGLELEVQALTRRMSTVANAAEVVLPEDTNVAEGNSQIPRHYDDICQARKHIEDLETEKVYLTKEAKQYREHISELVLHSEAQSSIYQEKFKELELMLSEIKRDPSVSNPSDSIANTTNKISLRPRGSRSNSPFKCITSLVQQVSSEKDHELSLARRRIEELEALAVNRQTEVCMLTARLAAVDSMTHDVIRDLLGVKIDMTNYANLIDGEQLQKLLEKVQEQSKESNTKDNEILDLKKQINYLMEERDRWIEEINQRKADVLGSQVTVEQHKQRDQLLTAQNELLKLDKANLQRRIAELDKEVRLLIRQQKAHNQMPKENNRHTVGSDELSKRLAESDKLLYHAKS